MWLGTLLPCKLSPSLIELWDDRYDSNKQLLVDKCMNKFDYMLTTIQCDNYFHMSKPKAIYSIYSFLNKFLVPTVILSEYIIFHLSLFSFILINLLMSLLFPSDIIWNWKWDLHFYYYPFCAEKMTKVWDYVTLLLYENNNSHSSEKGTSIYNWPYKEKSQFLVHIKTWSIGCDNKIMIHRYHFWLFLFILAFDTTWYNYNIADDTTYYITNSIENNTPFIIYQ